MRKIRYDGPCDWVNVGPHGQHHRDQVKEYPSKYAEELLVTSKKQQFVDVTEDEMQAGTVHGVLMSDEDGEAVIDLDAFIDAACLQAAEAGHVTASGKPTVEALELLLGKDVSAAERDEAWARVEERNKG